MKKNGYFLIEALLSIVIFSMLILSVFSMISFLQRRTVRSSFEAEAVVLLQDGMEIARSTLLADWNGYPNNTYFPVFDVSANSWTLIPGEEEGLEARYSRKIVVKKVCRDGDTGEILDYGSVCLGAIDLVTLEVVTTVWWDEGGQEREVSARLLVLNANE